MGVRRINCESCGAPIDWDGTYGKPVTCSYCGSTFLPAATGMEDVWLMTDPVARARYEFNGALDKLEHDIRYEVMRGQDWSEADHAYLREIARLEEAGVVRKLASFWAISPHPPVYRARADGEINLGGQRIPFRKGDEIVWACPMTRDRFDLDLPVLVGDFQDARLRRLCGEMASAMQGRMG
jgi:hypothetical protein